jgi:catechol 2,3-dioxygenase-like lactoylglutathione lyase family enzyme
MAARKSRRPARTSSSARAKSARKRVAKKIVRARVRRAVVKRAVKRALVKRAIVKRARQVRASRAAAPSAVPSGIGFVSQHMDYTSHAMDEIQHFYVDLLGFRESDRDPQMNYLYVRTGPSSSVGFMPPMPGPPEQWRPPREPNLYLFVENVDRIYRELSAKGVSFDSEPADMPWGHRVATLRDPEGRMVCLAQNLRG